MSVFGSKYAGWSDEKLSDFIASQPLKSKSSVYNQKDYTDTRFYDAEREAQLRQFKRDKEYRTAYNNQRQQESNYKNDMVATNERLIAADKRQSETASRLARERDERLNQYEIDARQREADSIKKREDQWKQQQIAYQEQQRISDERARANAEIQSKKYAEAALERSNASNEMMNSYQTGMDKSVQASTEAQKKASALLQPWMNFGLDAGGRLQKKINSGPGDYQQSPGYQARLNEGTRAIESSAAARGGALSGQAVKEAARFNQEFATQDYDNFLNRYYKSLDPLMQVSNMGQQAAGAMGDYLQRSGSEMGQYYQSGYENIANAQKYGGDSRAEGVEAGANIMAAQNQAKEERDFSYNAFQMGNRG